MFIPEDRVAIAFRSGKSWGRSFTPLWQKKYTPILFLYGTSRDALNFIFLKMTANREIMETTRVFVSGLPPEFSNEELTRHFSSRSQVTDARVIPKRRIGFVGFRDATAARDAVTYFNKSYIRMSKITVQVARPVSRMPNALLCFASSLT
jgi:hypothetical protein